MNNQLRYKELRTVSFNTISVNFILAVAKIIIGFLSRSTAVISDAIHTFSDVFTTLAVLFGLKISSEEPDTKHPYGHQKIESIISLFLAFILAITALYIGYEGIVKFFFPIKLLPSWPALIITILSIISKEWMFHYTKNKAIKLKSTSMLSDAWHHRTDSISSIAVLIGVVGTFFGSYYLDSIATMFVCIIILKAVYEIGITSINQVIDHCASPETCTEIKNLITSVEDVKRIDVIRTRISNNVIFVEAEIAVDSNLSLEEGHAIAHKIHDILEDSELSIQHCAVHINPFY